MKIQVVNCYVVSFISIIKFQSIEGCSLQSYNPEIAFVHIQFPRLKAYELFELVLGFRP